MVKIIMDFYRIVKTEFFYIYFLAFSFLAEIEKKNAYHKFIDLPIDYIKDFGILSNILYNIGYDFQGHG